MPNWFENNATKSIITYTLVIVVATSAVTIFLLKDNQVALIQSEVNAHKAVSDQYKSKADILSKDLETVRSENAEYRSWLSQSKEAVPAIMPRISELKTYIAALEGQVSELSKNSPVSVPIIRDARRGLPVIDKLTGLRLEVQEVTIDRHASILVKFPDRDTKTQLLVKGGEEFPFKHGPVAYKLSIVRVYYIADGIEFSVLQDKAP